MQCATFLSRTDPTIRYIVYPRVIALPPVSRLECYFKRTLRISRSIAKMAPAKSETEVVTGYNGSHSRPLHSSNHAHRSRSPTPMSQPSALVATAIGAIALTAVDKYVIEYSSKNDRSSLNNDYGTQFFRRFADVAIGGYAGLEAYRYFRSSPHEPSHQTSWHVKPDNDAPPKRRRRGDNHHHKRHLLEAAIGVLGVEQQLKANRKGYDKHRKRHALEIAIGAYGLGRELMATREN